MVNEKKQMRPWHVILISIAAVLTSIGTIGGFAWTLVGDNIDRHFLQVYLDYQEEEIKRSPRKMSFRDLLSLETKIPSDRIHIKFGEWYNSHIKFEELVDKVYPLLEQELNTVSPRLIIYSNGRAKWLHTDGEPYDATLRQDGLYWFVYNGEWKRCQI